MSRFAITTATDGAGSAPTAARPRSLTSITLDQTSAHRWVVTNFDDDSRVYPWSTPRDSAEEGGRRQPRRRLVKRLAHTSRLGQNRLPHRGLPLGDRLPDDRRVPGELPQPFMLAEAVQMGHGAAGAAGSRSDGGAHTSSRARSPSVRVVSSMDRGHPHFCVRRRWAGPADAADQLGGASAGHQGPPPADSAVAKAAELLHDLVEFLIVSVLGGSRPLGGEPMIRRQSGVPVLEHLHASVIAQPFEHPRQPADQSRGRRLGQRSRVRTSRAGHGAACRRRGLLASPALAPPSGV